MMTLAHTLKGAAGYIGASRIYYSCHFMNVNFQNGEIQKMLDFYQAVIEAVIEFKGYSRQLVCNYKKETYVKNSEDEVTDIPAGFKLIKDPASQYIYCCKPG